MPSRAAVAYFGSIGRVVASIAFRFWEKTDLIAGFSIVYLLQARRVASRQRLDLHSAADYVDRELVN